MKRKILIAASILCICYNINAQDNKQQQPPKPPTVEERVKKVNEKVDKELKLSDAKKKQVEAAYKDFFVKMDELRKKNGNTQPPPPPPPPPPGKKEDVDKLVKERDEKISKALSQDEYKKYVEVEKTLRPPMPPKPKDGEQAPPPPQKQ